MIFKLFHVKVNEGSFNPNLLLDPNLQRKTFELKRIELNDFLVKARNKERRESLYHFFSVSF